MVWSDPRYREHVGVCLTPVRSLNSRVARHSARQNLSSTSILTQGLNRHYRRYLARLFADVWPPNLAIRAAGSSSPLQDPEQGHLASRSSFRAAPRRCGQQIRARIAKKKLERHCGGRSCALARRRAPLPQAVLLGGCNECRVTNFLFQLCGQHQVLESLMPPASKGTVAAQEKENSTKVTRTGKEMDWQSGSSESRGVVKAYPGAQGRQSCPRPAPTPTRQDWRVSTGNPSSGTLIYA